MRLRYVGQHESTETFGKVFYRYKWTSGAELTDEARATLAQNPQFEVEPVVEATAADLGLDSPAAEEPVETAAAPPVDLKVNDQA